MDVGYVIDNIPLLATHPLSKRHFTLLSLDSVESIANRIQKEAYN